MDMFGNFKSLGAVNSDLEEYEHEDDNGSKDILDEKVEKPSFSFLYIFSIIIGFIFLFRLIDLQVAQGAKFQYLAEGNRIRSRNIPAPRGIIYDQKGQILAKNVASFSLELYPADLPQKKEDREDVYKKIEEISQIPLDEIKKDIEKIGLFSVDPITLKENISRDDALLLKVRYADVPGVSVLSRPNRQYETVPGVSHFLGYIGKISESEMEKDSSYSIDDWIGKTGIESTYEKDLKGEDGKEQIEVDSRGRIQRVLADINPKPGDNLILGIDLDLQKEMANDLQEMMGQTKVGNGVAVAIDPRDGTMLGMVSLPSYDNNLFTQGIKEKDYNKMLEDPNKPMINRVIAGLYPSGSTIKPIMAAAGLQEGIITPNTSIETPPEITIGDWKFPDWKYHTGVTNVTRAIAESNDIFFYALSGGYDKIKGLGADNIKKYLNDFGFGKATGIDLNGESSGLVPDPTWKKKVKNEAWYLGDTYHLGIGQGDFLTTPLQLLNATAAIANGGELLKPHLALKETDSTGNTIKEFKKEVVKKDFISNDNINIVREGMRQAVLAGSARQLQSLPVSSAAKTGTAQFGSGEQMHSWLTAFAPYDNPKISIAVLVEGGGEGNSAAEPVVNKILQWYFSRYKQ